MAAPQKKPAGDPKAYGRAVRGGLLGTISVFKYKPDGVVKEALDRMRRSAGGKEAGRGDPDTARRVGS